MKFLYGSAFRAPTFTEQYAINNPSEIGNENLKPETIDTYEVSVGYDITKQYAVQVNCFRNEIKDLITLGPKPSATEPAPYINRPGETTVNGVELELTADIGRNKYAYANVSYQDAEDFEGNELPDVADWKANLGINWKLGQFFNINGNLNWIGERSRPEGDTRDNLASATLVDVTLIAKNFYKSLEFRASVYNVFDEDYRDPSPNPLVPNDFPNNVRTFVLEARYTF